MIFVDIHMGYIFNVDNIDIYKICSIMLRMIGQLVIGGSCEREVKDLNPLSLQLSSKR